MMVPKIIAIVSIAVSVMGATYPGPQACDPAEVIKRVCTRYIDPPTSSACFADYNRADDTGYGKKATDLIDMKLLAAVNAKQKNADDIPESVKKTLTYEDENVWQRYKKLYENVQSAYQKLFDQMPEPDRTYFTERMKNYEPFPANLRTSLSAALRNGPNADFDDNQEGINVTPILMNYPGLSDAEIEMILAHEFGHALDQEIPHRLSSMARVNLAHTEGCFEKNYAGKGEVKKTRDEDFADFMASQVASALIEQGKDDVARRARALNWAYFFCKADPSSHPTLSALAILSDKESHDSNDVHRADSERIFYLMNNREMMNRIGCKYTSPCSLWQNQKH